MCSGDVVASSSSSSLLESSSLESLNARMILSEVGERKRFSFSFPPFFGLGRFGFFPARFERPLARHSSVSSVSKESAFQSSARFFDAAESSAGTKSISAFMRALSLRRKPQKAITDSISAPSRLYSWSAATMVDALSSVPSDEYACSTYSLTENRPWR